MLVLHDTCHASRLGSNSKTMAKVEAYYLSTSRWMALAAIIMTLPRTSLSWSTFFMINTRGGTSLPTWRAVGVRMTTAPMPAAASGDPFASFGCESTSRADWLKVGVGLASLVPLVAAAGTQDVLAASGGGSNVVTVLGAGGKTGRECVEYLGARGTSVRAVARSLTDRDGEPLKFKVQDGVKLETADVTIPASLPGVIRGSSAVIFASSASKQGGSAKAVDFEGVVNVARTCLDLKVPRLVVVSSGGVASPESSIYKFLNLFGEIMAWKIRGENELRAMYAAQGPGAACHYTIVRPGGLTLDPPRGVSALELNQGDTKSGRIARADVAAICAESIFSQAAEDCTFECYYKDTGKSLNNVGLSNAFKQTTAEGATSLGTERTGSTWEAIFTGLKHDA